MPGKANSSSNAYLWYLLIVLICLTVVIGSSFYINEIKHAGDHDHSHYSSLPQAGSLIVDVYQSITGHDPEQVVCYRESHRNFYFFCFFMLVSVVGLVVFGLFNQRRFSKALVRKNEEIQSQSEIIEKTNEDLLSGLRYASTIQHAFLPGDDSLKDIFNEYFIFYQPRDQVSGDFFWVFERNGKRIICLGDCTGHGVAAAFLSITCINLLNKIAQEDLPDPGSLLTKLQRELASSFSDKEINDGLTLSVCFVVDSKMTFAGAYQSLFYIQDGKGHELKGDRRGLGQNYIDIHTQFMNTEIPLLGGEVFYLFTDGMTDQFGGEKGKKIGKKAFLEWLEDVSSSPIEVQEKVLKNLFVDWKGKHLQTDDATLLGFRL